MAEEQVDDDDGLALEEANLEHVSNLYGVMEKEVREGTLNGTIPSVTYDTAATSSCGKYGDPFIPAGRRSTKIFQTPTGHKVPASEVILLDHDLRSPAREVHIMPELTETTLVSTAKLAEAGYVSIFDMKSMCTIRIIPKSRCQGVRYSKATSARKQVFGGFHSPRSNHRKDQPEYRHCDSEKVSNGVSLIATPTNRSNLRCL